ncbi:hypothetical protein LguiA_012957 [Lonicera macranthoides]
MVFNSVLVSSVAHTSADIWQKLACFGERNRISSSDLLELVICFPLQQFGRLALSLWNFFCVPPPSTHSYYTYSHYDDSESESDSDSTNPDYEHNDRYYYDSHSD